MKRMATVIGVGLLAVVVGFGVIFYMRGSEERLFSALEAGRRPTNAVARLKKVVNRHPENLNAQQWLLKLEIEKGDWGPAQNRLNLLQLKAPDYYGTLSNGCAFYLHRRQASKAARDCLRAVEKSGRAVEDLNRLASAYLLLEDYFKALPTLQEAERKAPNNVKVMNNMGYYFLLAGIPEEAAKYFKKALDKDPNFIEARKNLARAYYESKQYQAAATEIEKILAREPLNKDMLMIMAIIQSVYFHDKAAGTKYAKRAIEAGMDKERAQALVQMLTGGQPLPTPMPGSVPAQQTPMPIGPGQLRELQSQPGTPAAGATVKTTP